MVTGDHKLTAAAIARELGILGGEGQRELKAIEGRELDKMSEEQLAAIVEDVAVYARVSPEHKLKIVGAWKSKKHVVAMTGDGVNDAPALKRADIGVAMGITGTDVTREASDMVLMDDNFATIVAAVEEGRIIYDNIKKYLTFLLSCNVAEILILGIAGMIGWAMPLIALQILWVNLTTDGLPALALGVEPAEPDLMGRPPRDPDEPVFAGSVLWALSAMSVLIFIGLMPIFYWYWQNEGLEQAQTMALATLVVYELFYAFNCRSLRFTLPQLGLFTNKWLLPAVLSSGLLLLAVIYIPSWGMAFHTVPLSFGDWDVIFIVAGGSFLLVELGKWIFGRKRAQAAEANSGKVAIAVKTEGGK
jgi:Ca2+-transporting ATPase